MRRYTVVDVFTDTPLQGNPLAVFLDGSGLSDEVMQRTARELNLSETVFLLPDERVRIFTPTTELPFAGHPVLGAAFVLGKERVRLKTGAGVVPVTVRDGYGEMEQPAPTLKSFPAQERLFAALGVDGSELPLDAYSNGPLHVYVALDDEEAVASLRPDMRALADLGDFGVSCFTHAGDRVKTRMFGPSLGVDEDPATGSAAGPLALHLVRHGRIAHGKQITISQGAEIGRPSTLYARVEPDGRVLVGGSAVTIARGEFLV
jgi:trans-2,3-dihydro-3-hydroxyanthranilate isomerase